MTSGIYCFKHKTKPFIYIGSSVHIEERYNQHLDLFLRKTHHNLALQKDYLNDELSFEILAKGIVADNLIKAEQFYCEQFLDNGYLLYNSKLPRPQGYENNMLCSKNYCDMIKDLVEENRRLQSLVGYPSQDNIFVELLEKGV